MKDIIQHRYTSLRFPDILTFSYELVQCTAKFIDEFISKWQINMSTVYRNHNVAVHYTHNNLFAGIETCRKLPDEDTEHFGIDLRHCFEHGLTRASNTVDFTEKRRDFLVQCVAMSENKE